MPRRIDVADRTAVIAAASLRVLERDGLAALSVRRVADEAGIAAASLRRAFATQNALRVYCLTLIQERVTARIRALRSDGEALALDVLAQLLPLDAERRTEFLAQTQLGVLALTDPDLRPAVLGLNAAVAEACSAVVVILDHAGLLASHRSPDIEAERLHALIDGIAIHAIWAPGGPRVERTAGLIEHHLRELRADPSRTVR